MIKNLTKIVEPEKLGEKVEGSNSFTELGMCTYLFSLFEVLSYEQKTKIYTLKPLLIKRYFDINPIISEKVAELREKDWIFYNKGERAINKIIKEKINNIKTIKLSESELRPCRFNA